MASHDPPLKPRYHGYLEPVFPCREIHTRHCPASFDAVCPGPCARYESEDPTPWLPELPPREEWPEGAYPDDQP